MIQKAFPGEGARQALLNDTISNEGRYHWTVSFGKELRIVQEGTTGAHLAKSRSDLERQVHGEGGSIWHAQGRCEGG